MKDQKDGKPKGGAGNPGTHGQRTDQYPDGDDPEREESGMNDTKQHEGDIQQGIQQDQYENSFHCLMGKEYYGSLYCPSLQKTRVRN